MNVPEQPVVIRDAPRRLSEEARQRAGSLPAGSADHMAGAAAGPAPLRFALPTPDRHSKQS